MCIVAFSFLPKFSHVGMPGQEHDAFINVLKGNMIQIRKTVDTSLVWPTVELARLWAADKSLIDR